MAKKIEKVDVEIEHVLAKMASLEPGTEQYGMAAMQLKTLKETKGLLTSKSVSPDVLFSAAAALVQILVIMGHERLNVISTKAFGFLTKGHH